jgi:tetratricopeptide (TPR) repeat protein
MAADAPATPREPLTATAEVLRLVGDDPARAVTVADQLVDTAARADDRRTVSAALRARGLARRELGNLDAALADLTEAIEVAASVNATEAVAEARMSLVGVYAERGDMRAALVESELAAADLTGPPLARMRAQRGALLGRAGRFAEALEEFRRALPVLRISGDREWEAKALNNRSTALAYQGALREAAADAARSEELFLSTGHPLHAADACWNRGFVAARLGDVPLALTHFDTAEARYAQHGIPATEIFLDRCDLLLTVGLHAEALAYAERAIDATAGAGNSLWADAHLALAQAALAVGDRARAHAAAGTAAGLFQRQDRPAWATVARYTQLRCADAGDEVGAEALARALETADELAAGGWAVQELDARIIAARIALRGNQTAIGRQQLRLASAAKRAATMDVRARAWHAEALLRLADGDRPGAEGALREGLQALDEHRATLGATELRVHTAVYGEELAGLGLRLALGDRDPAEVLRWVERWRAGALRWRPVRPPDDAVLADLLAELRRVAGQEEEERLDGGSPGALRRQRQALERQVLHRTRRSVGDPDGVQAAATTMDPAALRDALGGRALVEYLVTDGELYAVTVRRGSVRLHDLGPAVAAKQLLDQVRFALRGLACGTTPAARSAARRLLDSQAGLLDERLLRPLAGAVGDAELVLVPSSALRDLPWALLPTCAGRPVSVVPSAMLWVRAQVRGAAPGEGRITLVGGPGLTGADEEVRRLGAFYPGAAVLRGPHASATAVLTALDGAKVAHIAAHGTVRADNPFFSALHVADGPLTVFDLERLDVPPELVVLPACQSGVTVARPCDELLGLTAALLALGSRCLIASVAPIPDLGAERLMIALHERLRAGEQPAPALAAAQQALRDGDDEAYATVAAFACYGAGS